MDMLASTAAVFFFAGVIFGICATTILFII